MAYSAGMLNKRITIAKRVSGQTPTSATDTGKARYEILATVWAAETWNKGAKAMQSGVLDAYDTVMFRMRYRSDVDRWCLIQYHGRWYQIQSLNSDYQENQLQITATELANQKVTIVEPNYVDLGLPSGTLWARFNVGATKETEAGDFYMYGKGATPYRNGDSRYEDTESPLDAQYDTATQVIGTGWHMPTKAQFDELKANTTYTVETNFNGSGVKGGKFTAANGKYIFIPFAGYYTNGMHLMDGKMGNVWTSSPVNSSHSYLIILIDGGIANSESRIYGCSVRGVKG